MKTILGQCLFFTDPDYQTSTAHFLRDTFSLQSNYDLSSHTLAEGVAFETVDGLPKVEVKLTIALLVLCVVSLT